MSSKQFNLEIQDFTAQVLREAQQLQRTVAETVLAGLILKTPRDTTDASRSWLVSIDNPLNDYRQATFEDGLATIRTSPLFATIWIVNNSDYILVLEDGLFVPPDPGPSKDPRPGRFGRILVSGGYSTQAPGGIAKAVVSEVELAFGD